MGEIYENSSDRAVPPAQITDPAQLAAVETGDEPLTPVEPALRPRGEVLAPRHTGREFFEAHSYAPFKKGGISRAARGIDQSAMQPEFAWEEELAALPPRERLQQLILPGAERQAEVVAAIEVERDRLCQLHMGDPEAERQINSVANGIRWMIAPQPDERLPDCFVLVDTQAIAGISVWERPEIPDKYLGAFGDNELIKRAIATCAAAQKGKEDFIRQAQTELLHESAVWKFVEQFYADSPAAAEKQLDQLDKTMRVAAQREKLGLSAHPLPSDPNYYQYTRYLGSLEVATTEQGRHQQPPDPIARMRTYFWRKVCQTQAEKFPDLPPFIDADLLNFATDQDMWNLDLPTQAAWRRLQKVISVVAREITGPTLNRAETFYAYDVVRAALKNDRRYSKSQFTYRAAKEATAELLNIDFYKTTCFAFLHGTPIDKSDALISIREYEYDYEMAGRARTGNIRPEQTDRETYETLGRQEIAWVLVDERNRRERQDTRLIMTRARSMRLWPAGQDPVLRIQFDPNWFPTFGTSDEPFIPGFVVSNEWETADGQRVFDFGRAQQDPYHMPPRRLTEKAQQHIAEDSTRRGYAGLKRAIDQARKLNIGGLSDSISEHSDYYLPPRGVVHDPFKPVNGRPQLHCQSAAELMDQLLQHEPGYQGVVIRGATLGSGPVINGQGHVQLLVMGEHGPSIFDPTPSAGNMPSSAPNPTQDRRQIQLQPLPPRSETAGPSPEKQIEVAAATLTQARHDFEEIFAIRYGLERAARNQVWARLKKLHPSPQDPMRTVGTFIASAAPQFTTAPAEQPIVQLREQLAGMERTLAHLAWIAAGKQMSGAQAARAHIPSPEMATQLAGLLTPVRQAYATLIQAKDRLATSAPSA